MKRLSEEWAIFLLAVQFLTRLPVRTDWTEERMAATPRWYPAVGILLGVAVALVYWLAALGLPQGLAVLLSTAAGVLLTGAFHEDGFADTCDGLGGGVTRERKLEIMKDSRLGTYGALGLGLMVAVKVVTLTALPPALVPVVLVAGHAVSRASAVAVIATGTYVRDHGTGKPVATGQTGMPVMVATAALACVPLGLVAGLGPLGAALLGLVLGHLAMRRVVERQLGGYTGDGLGAVQQVSEVGMYLGVLIVVAG